MAQSENPDVRMIISCSYSRNILHLHSDTTHQIIQRSSYVLGKFFLCRVLSLFVMSEEMLPWFFLNPPVPRPTYINHTWMFKFSFQYSHVTPDSSVLKSVSWRAFELSDSRAAEVVEMLHYCASNAGVWHQGSAVVTPLQCVSFRVLACRKMFEKMLILWQLQWENKGVISAALINLQMFLQAGTLLVSHCGETDTFSHANIPVC